jgi:deoxyribonuclease IV
VSHASYLINLATSLPQLREQSIAAFVDELDRAESLGLRGVVIHPGTCTAGTEEDALRLIAEAIESAFKARPHQKVKVVLEHTAGQGRTVGHQFEHLSAILTHLDGSPRVGVCLDTCHLLASGYNITDPSGYDDTFESFERLIGLGRLEVFHGNDSKRPCGSRVDRHEHIGKGFVGLEPFRRLLSDPRFGDRAILIETEKARNAERAGTLLVDPFDKKNLNTLRRLRRTRAG